MSICISESKDKNMDPIMVSIHCITYNHEKYIGKALESFVMQNTNFKYEVIVHDDASSDGTAEIIKDYAKKYPDIIKPILEKENQYSRGVKIRLEKMLPVTSGKYIALCEGDDYWTDDSKLQRQVDYMEAHPSCSLIAHQAVRISENGKVICAFSKDNHKEDYDLDFADVIENRSSFPTASMLYRTSFHERNKTILQSCYNTDFVYKLLLAGNGYIHMIVRKMSAYRVAAKGSWTIRVRNPHKRIEHQRKSIDALKKINEYFGFRYDKEISRDILLRYYICAEEKGDFASLKEKEFKEIYDAETMWYKVKRILKHYTPSILYWLQKLRNAIRGKSCKEK